MGQVKHEWERAVQQGWSAPEEKMVCQDCVDDVYLKHLINQAACSKECDYCGKKTAKNFAAPVEAIMGAIAHALNYRFAEPTEAGMPWDEGEWVFETTDTADALMALPLNCNDDLFEDIASSFVNTEWTRAAGGHWSSPHPNEEWVSDWEAFAEYVTHRSRYFFMDAANQTDGISSGEPVAILRRVAEMANELDLYQTLPARAVMYRVRERGGDADWEICADSMGAPPKERAAAGRMNPAGIPYLYLSTSMEGALAEVLRGPPCQAVVAQFEITRLMRVLDLTRLPDLPSIFDEAQSRRREVILFFLDFVGHICRPVQKNGGEHVSYVPSQVVCEYFAQVFRLPDGARLDGIAYPSAVAPGCVNVTLFPGNDSDAFRGAVDFRCADQMSFDTWAEFSEAIADKK